MWFFVDELVVWFESVVGYKQTSSHPKSKSALPPKADILVAVTDLRF